MKFKLAIFVSLLLTSCISSKKPTIQEIIGVWESEDGARMIFYPNKKIKVLHLSKKHIFDEEGNITGNGNWKFEDKGHSYFWKINISINDTITNKLIGFDVLVSREGLGFGNSKINSLFIWKGDPDLDDRYEFYKIH